MIAAKKRERIALAQKKKTTDIQGLVLFLWMHSLFKYVASMKNDTMQTLATRWGVDADVFCFINNHYLQGDDDEKKKDKIKLQVTKKLKNKSDVSKLTQKELDGFFHTLSGHKKTSKLKEVGAITSFEFNH